MEVISFSPYLQSLTKEAAQRVISSLNRTERGNPTDYVTPLISRDVDPDEGRVKYINEFLPKVMSQYEWLNQAEIDQSEKIGSASIMLPYADRREKVHLSFMDKPTNIDEKAFSLAVVRLRNRLGFKNLHAASLIDAYNNMPPGTNQGAPFFSNETQYRLESYWLAERIARNGYIWDVDPCLLYSRTSQRGIGKDPSQRVIWGYPHYVVIIGLTIQMTLLPLLRTMPVFAAWNNLDTVDLVATDMIERARHKILSVDFSGFDAHLIKRIIHSVFDVLREMFARSETPKLNFLENTMLEIGLLTPEGILLGTHGMPSGDPLTNLVDTFGQLIIDEYSAIRCGYTIEDQMAQGDDGALTFSTPWDIELFAKAALELNQELSADKSGISETELTFLQNWHSLEYQLHGVSRHVYPLMRALGKSLSYEGLTSPWDGFDDTWRWWQIFENCKYHPEFESAAELLYRHDRYSRTLSGDQILAKTDGLEPVKAALHQEGFPYGKESLNNWRNWRIVQELNQLRARGHL